MTQISDRLHIKKLGPGWRWIDRFLSGPKMIIWACIANLPTIPHQSPPPNVTMLPSAGNPNSAPPSHFLRPHSLFDPQIHKTLEKSLAPPAARRHECPNGALLLCTPGSPGRCTCRRRPRRCLTGVLVLASAAAGVAAGGGRGRSRPGGR
jgi:hypothetical protein